MFKKFKKAKKVILVNATSDDFIRVEICTGLIKYEPHTRDTYLPNFVWYG